MILSKDGRTVSRAKMRKNDLVEGQKDGDKSKKV